MISITAKKSEGEKREVGIELLRVLLAIMIVANHSICHGIEVYLPEVFEEYSYLFQTVQILANPAVDIFFLISGYYGITRSRKKVLSFLQPIYFYAIIILLFLFMQGNRGLSLCVKTILFPWELWWFAASYLILLLLSPYINLIVEKLQERDFSQCVLILVLINTVQGFLLNGGFWGNGFTSINAVVLYLIGRWIRINYEKIAIYQKNGVIIIFTFCLFAIHLLIQLFAYRFGIVAIQSRNYSYNNPLVVVEAIMIFLLFKQVKGKCGSIISIFAQSVFPVYLLTDHEGMREYVFRPLLQSIGDDKYVIVIPIFLYACIIVLLIGGLDWWRRFLMKLITEKIMSGRL